MPKRNQRLHDYQTLSKKVLCGRFAETVKTTFAVGDQDNNLIIYNAATTKPIHVFGGPSNFVASLTALCFLHRDEQIVVGSSRGAVNVWDLSTTKIACTLKGHTVQVSALTSDPTNESLMLSSSSDTQVKVWDLRSRTNIQNLKLHKKRVGSLCVCPDSRYYVSGGDDGTIHVTDARTMKPLFQYETASPVLSLDCNRSLVIAAGCLDRYARIYQEGMQLGSTKSDTMPVVSCVFYNEEFLVTAGTDNLKVWDISAGITMTDNIETGSKGILHTIVEDHQIQQITFSSGMLSYHQCPLSVVNFSGSFIQSSTVIEAPNLSKVKVLEQYQETQNTPPPRRGVSMPKSVVGHITDQQRKSIVAKKNQVFARQLGSLHTDLAAMSKALQANFSFKELSQQLQLAVSSQHAKFMRVMGGRAQALSLLLDLWRRGNYKGLTMELAKVDVFVAMSVFRQIFQSNKMQISVEVGLVVAQKAKEMVSQKSPAVLKAGLEYLQRILAMFRDDILRLKNMTGEQGVDLKREERIRRYDALVGVYADIQRTSILERLVEQDEDSSKLARKLIFDLNNFLPRIFPVINN